MVITAKVGDGRNGYDGYPSTVILPRFATVTARGGKQGWYQGQGGNMGGNGYSGGAGGGHPRFGGAGWSGGSNGGNGNGYGNGNMRGGMGTGENLAAYTLDHFKLSPGQGGKYYHDSNNNNFYYGGGGGGVLVDYDGPSTSPWQGKGYGGGGGGNHSSEEGLPGVILVEVVRL